MTRYIIDCDPGHDDAMAILYAAKHLDVVGLTTVAGNSSLENSTRNALAICTLAGLSLPVVPGLDRALIEPPLDGAYVHGAMIRWTGMPSTSSSRPPRPRRASSA